MSNPNGFDALINASSAMKEAINCIGGRFGLPNGWLKMLLVAIHGANIFVIFLFTIDIPSAKRKLILVLYLLITNLIIHKILKKFGKVWFK